MNAVETISRVLGAGLLVQELTIIPPRGATVKEIREEEVVLGRSLYPDHVAILRRWNGIALEVIRLFGCGAATGEIGSAWLIIKSELVIERREKSLSVRMHQGSFTFKRVMGVFARSIPTAEKLGCWPPIWMISSNALSLGWTPQHLLGRSGCLSCGGLGSFPDIECYVYWYWCVGPGQIDNRKGGDENAPE